MGGNLANRGAHTSAIAMARHNGSFKAAEVRKNDTSFELVWAKTADASGQDWTSFAAECGLPLSAGRDKKNDHRKVVVGFGSAGAAFYRIEAPDVGPDETEAIVRMQAETLLPLPADQMEVAWRRGAVRDDSAAITIVAARSQTLRAFVGQVSAIEPSRIWLDCEGTAKAWDAFFSGREKDVVVLSVTAQSMQVCIMEQSRLSNAAVLDVGLADFLGSAPGAPEDIDVLEQTEITERYAQDVQSILEAFGLAQTKALPVYVLSDGNGVYEQVARSLRASGINARTVLPRVGQLSAPEEFGAAQIFEYRVPIGLALMALETPKQAIDVFASVYRPGEKERPRAGLLSPKVSGAIAAAVLALLVIVSYAVDVTNEKRLRRFQEGAGFKELLEQRALMKTVALHRPDLLELLSEINSGDNAGVTLDSLYFKKGQPVKITGQVRSTEQLYDFHESLLSKKGIKHALIPSTSTDSKSKMITFTITFDWKTFTQRSAKPTLRKVNL
jgi:hypothetical protein